MSAIQSFKQITFGILHDTLNRFRYGIAAPGKNQIVWVDPQAIGTQIDSFDEGFQRAILGKAFAHIPPHISAGNRAHQARMALHRAPGMVLWSDFDRHVVPFSEHGTFRMMCRMFDQGLDWEAAGFYDRMMKRTRKGPGKLPSTRDDVVARYARLDPLVERMRAGGCFDPPPGGLARYRGVDGVMVAVGRGGELIFAHSGAHRLSLAKCFGLPRIPVNVCAVHGEALRSGAWKRLLLASRREPGSPRGADGPADDASREASSRDMTALLPTRVPSRM
ncbi:hypothetical protein [Roseitranquillus sediminis]|uniref:hypothetical protein n=1 Tax=Roseitranquillus sediminis TaxID=2809051 RepID=UPI001D0C9AC9|nr:hypothetical protein [Roseitranquillus sediminis]MBM9593844.1 hypothetical protein [Roseitranquillus sediminis]